MRYIVYCTSGLCGVEETIIVDAEDETQAEKFALDFWIETLQPAATCEREATDDDDGYEEIN